MIIQPETGVPLINSLEGNMGSRNKYESLCVERNEIVNLDEDEMMPMVISTHGD
jgi:hypothetical protein